MRDSINPLRVHSIDYIEVAFDALTEKFVAMFEDLGFERTAENAETHSVLFVQGNVRIVACADPSATSRVRRYVNDHGEGVSKIAFAVEDADFSIKEAIRRGALRGQESAYANLGESGYREESILSFGDVIHSFVQRDASRLLPGFEARAGSGVRPVGIDCVDHITISVPKGEMDEWVSFYERVFGFVQTRFFDVKGLKTGLQSKVVQSLDGRIILPINEPEQAGSKSQIQEFLDRHSGAGVQHIALLTQDGIATVGELRSRGLKFLKIPDTYYEDLPNRGVDSLHQLDALRETQVLVDGDKDGHLIQCFTDVAIGPMFFEIIQRMNHTGFGEGNFTALFDAIERDQIERGYLN